MSVRFYDLTITDVTKETADAISITFDVPEEIRSTFLYKSGQYLTVRIVIDGVEHRRNYSLCSSPAHNEPLRIAVKLVQMGAVSQWLCEHAKPGMHLEVYPPMGNFTKELDPDHKRHYLMFAGGSGITPILSILKSILRIEQQSTVTLVYANRDEHSILFDNELAKLAAEHQEHLHLIHVLEQAGSLGKAVFTGRLDTATTQAVMQHIAPNLQQVDAFVCGPVGMMDSVIATLQENGVPDVHIHREYFTINKPSPATTPTDMQESTLSSADSSAIIARMVTVRLYGDEHTFEVLPEETILSAAQRANLDPPYACQIGACCTCRAKITNGKVVMDEREALSDDEIDEGYALTCQSHPITDNVFADYDQ